MPLQGYKSQVRPIVAQPQATSTAAPQLAAQQLAGLSQRLEQFSGNIFRMAAENSKVKAADNAMADVNKYRQETNRILSSDLSESDKQKKLAGLQESHEYDGWGHVYKNSYKTTFDAAYANTVTTDAKAAADIAAAESDGSSEAFANIWGKYSDSIVRAAPTDALAATAKMALTKNGSANFKSLATAEWKKDYATKKKSSEKVLEHLQEEYITAYSNYDKAGMDSSISQYGAAVQSAIDSGFMTKDEAGVNIKIATEDATSARFCSDFSQAIQHGEDASKVIKNTFNSKEFQKLPQKKKDELMTSMFSDLKAKNTRKKDARNEAEYFETEMQEENYKETLLLAMTNNTTSDDISRMEIKGELNSSDATSLKQTLATKGRTISNGAKLAEYYKDSNLMSVTSDEIMNDALLADKDKIALFKKQEQLKSTKYKWTTSQDGKEARDRVKRLFGIQEGTFMAQLDMNNKTGRAFDKMYTALFDEISNLPQNEQERQSITIANRMILEYNESLKSDADSKKEQIKQKRIEKAKAKKSDYDDSVSFMWDSLVGEPKSEEWFIKQSERRGR